MKRIILVLALLATSASASEKKLYVLNGTYGSLAYEGKVERIEDANSVIFHVERLRLTYLPESKLNATNQIVKPFIRLITTTRAPDGIKGSVIYEVRIKTAVTLNASRPEAILENLKFSVPTATLDSSDYAGLSITDDRLMWPLHKDMKR